MKKPLIVIAFLLFLSAGYAQRFKEYTFTSTHQIDKTGNGSILKSDHKAVIFFIDPKPATNPNADLDYRPKGKLVIRYAKLDDPIVNEIIYFGNTYEFGAAKNQALYGISKSDTDYNIYVFVNKVMKIDGVLYNNLVIVGTRKRKLLKTILM